MPDNNWKIQNFNIRRDTWNTTGPKAISCASLCASAAVHCSFVYLLCIIPDLFLCPERVVEKTDEIFEKERFASVILPTGAGKSFVALSQLMEHKDEEILYLAPQNEILEQMKDYIIKYIHGPVNTIGRTKDEIIADIFPKLKFSTYPGLLSKAGEEIINKQYGFVVLD